MIRWWELAGRAAPLGLAALALAGLGPLVLHEALRPPRHLLGDLGWIAYAPLAMNLGFGLICLAAIGGLRRPERPGRAALIALAGPALGVATAAAVTVALGGDVRQSLLEHLGPAATLGALPLVAASLAREDTPPAERGWRVALAAAAVVFGALATTSWGRGFLWTCFGDPLPARFAAMGTLDSFPTRVAAELSALVWIVVALRRGPSWLLRGALIWALGRLLLDVGALAAATAVVDEGPSIDGLARACDVVEGVSLGGAALCWAWGGLRRSPDLARAWWLLPLLAVAGTAALEPSLGGLRQQLPAPLWRELDDFVPARVDRPGDVPWAGRRDVPLVLFGRREAWTFRGDRRDRGELFFTGDARAQHEVLVDARVRWGPLRERLQTGVWGHAVQLVWRRSPLIDQRAARARWAFAELAARGLSGLTVFVVERAPTDCAPLSPGARVCADQDAAVVVLDASADRARVTELLRQTPARVPWIVVRAPPPRARRGTPAPSSARVGADPVHDRLASPALVASWLAALAALPLALLLWRRRRTPEAGGGPYRRATLQAPADDELVGRALSAVARLSWLSIGATALGLVLVWALS